MTHITRVWMLLTKNEFRFIQNTLLKEETEEYYNVSIGKRMSIKIMDI
jgi:hypothetical protein